MRKPYGRRGTGGDPLPASGAQGACWYCGKRLTFFSWLLGKRRFCCSAHRARYKKDAELLALEALGWEQPIKSPQAGLRLVRNKRPTPLLADYVALKRPSATAADPVEHPAIRRPGTPIAPQAVKLGDTPPAPAAHSAGWETLAAAVPLAVQAVTTPRRRSARGVGMPLASSLRTTILPDFEPTSVPPFTPAGSGPVSTEPNVTGLDREIRFHRRRFEGPAESSLDAFQPVSAHDLSRGVAQPAAIEGEAVEFRLGPVTETVSRRALRLRRVTTGRRGVFVPRLLMGTLRPRMAFGPGLRLQ